jgi:site-specific DNA-methyltransferase (adenine-specific)
MMESIENFGQLQPIVINRNNELIYGGRRLAACAMLQRKVRACYKDTVDPVLMRELEIEENLQRKAFTPAEECLAIEELVKMKQKKYGKPIRGKEGGFTLEDAADVVGKTKGNVIEAIQIAEMVKSFPDLSKAKTKSEIKKAYKGLQRIEQNISALENYKETAEKESLFSLKNTNALDHMKTIEDSSIDLLFTDPPYGIDIDSIAMTTGGKTGGELSGTGIKYDDSEENALSLYHELAKESYRFTNDSAHALIFLAPSHFQTVKTLFFDAGWICSERPVIWIKQGSGQNNQPDKWFSSAYEMLLFARKPLSKVTLQGKPDWLQHDIVTSSNKIHQAEKPVGLCKELISRVALPGQKMYDPFIGSGALVEAGCEMKLFVIGCEIAVESFATTIARMKEWEGRN